MKIPLFPTVRLTLALTGVPIPAMNAQEGTPPAPRPMAPFHVLFNNDTTNLLSCESPYHPPGAKGFTEAMIRSSVDEAAVPGVDAQLLAPGLGGVPWWPSRLEPIAEHMRWFKERFGVEGKDAVEQYLLSGGDLIGPFVDECHRKGVAAFVSLRLNDIQHLERSNGNAIPSDAQTLSRFHVEHPQYWLSRNLKAASGRGDNWAIPEVPAYKVAMASEICSQYDLDGFDLDFLRAPYYFQPLVPVAERVAIMTGFIRQIRGILDRTARNGRHRWLSVRVPASRADWPAIGLDPAAWSAAGAEIFQLSGSYCWTQQADIPALRAAAPAASIYLEVTHTPVIWSMGPYDDKGFRRSTLEMIETGARLAYARGADGMSAYNFYYYRPYGPHREDRGPFCDPPFRYLTQVSETRLIPASPAYYFFDATEKRIRPGESFGCSMDMLPAISEGRLRIQIVTEAELHVAQARGSEASARGRWQATLNGRRLEPVENTAAYPFPTPFKAGFGAPREYLAFRVPPGTVADGLNRVILLLADGPADLHLRWIDAFFPSRE